MGRVGASKEHVALHAPRHTPPVLNLPEVLAVGVRAVADDKGAMVGHGAALSIVEHARGLELEDPFAGLDGDGDWLLGHGGLESSLVALGNVPVAGNLGAGGSGLLG